MEKRFQHQNTSRRRLPAKIRLDIIIDDIIDAILRNLWTVPFYLQVKKQIIIFRYEINLCLRILLHQRIISKKG